MEAIERENAQNLPGSAFQRHNVDIQQSVEEIKVGHEGFYIMVLKFDKSWSTTRGVKKDVRQFFFPF